MTRKVLSKNEGFLCKIVGDERIDFVIPGPCVGKSYGHGRGWHRRAKPHIFLKKLPREYQARISWYVKFFTHAFQPAGKIRAILIFRFFTKQKKKRGKLKYTKPDEDNLIKSCLDGLEPLIGDDSKVTPRAVRIWGDKDETVIRIRNIK